jgi:nitrogen fixation NifU-like protein
MTTELYNDAIIAEAKEDFGHGSLDHFDAELTRDNPLCGDRVRLQVALDGKRVMKLAHRTRGCLLTRAAMSILARHANGTSLAELRDMHAKVRSMLENKPVEGLWPELEMLAPASEVKSRHECVLLPFEAIEMAFEESR